MLTVCMLLRPCFFIFCITGPVLLSAHLNLGVKGVGWGGGGLPKRSFGSSGIINAPVSALAHGRWPNLLMKNWPRDQDNKHPYQ